MIAAIERPHAGIALAPVPPVAPLVTPVDIDHAEQARDFCCTALCHIQSADHVIDMALDGNPPDELFAISVLLKKLWSDHGDTNEAPDLGSPATGLLCNLQCALSSTAALIRRANSNSLEDGSVHAACYLLASAEKYVEQAMDCLAFASSEQVAA